MVLGFIAPDDDCRLNLARIHEIHSQVTLEVLDGINQKFGTYKPKDLRNADDLLQEEIHQKIYNLVGNALHKRQVIFSQPEIDALAADIGHRVLGFGWLDSLLPPMRTDISEITMYSSGLIQVMPKGSVRWENIDMQVELEDVWRVLNLILGEQNKAINEATPRVSAKLPATRDNPGGGRIEIGHPSLSPDVEGPYPFFNIRLYEQKPVQPEWLLERRLMSSGMMAYLAQAMQDGRRIMITGMTRTGKTTLLSALCNYLPAGYRIVKIEDPAEIWINRPTVQSVEARHMPPGSEIKPFTLADGVDMSLRLSPDYLILGEVRDGKSAAALLRALMTGHSGASTFHADSPQEAVERMMTVMGTDAGVAAEHSARAFSYAVDVLVQIHIRHELRIVTTIAEVQRNRVDSFTVIPEFIPVWMYDDRSPADAPRWIKADALPKPKE